MKYHHQLLNFFWSVPSNKRRIPRYVFLSRMFGFRLQDSAVREPTSGQCKIKSSTIIHVPLKIYFFCQCEFLILKNCQLTCHSGLANHIFSNPAFLFSDISARKSHNPLKSLTSRRSESLGNNMPGRAAIIREKFKAATKKIVRKNFRGDAILRQWKRWQKDPRKPVASQAIYFRGRGRENELSYKWGFKINEILSVFFKIK